MMTEFIGYTFCRGGFRDTFSVKVLCTGRIIEEDDDGFMMRRRRLSEGCREEDGDEVDDEGSVDEEGGTHDERWKRKS